MRAHLLHKNFSRNFNSIRSGQVLHLANELDVRSVLHGKMSSADVNKICVIHKAMNGCKNVKIH